MKESTKQSRLKNFDAKVQIHDIAPALHRQYFLQMKR
jgi:hypothetical protein